MDTIALLLVSFMTFKEIYKHGGGHGSGKGELKLLRIYKNALVATFFPGHWAPGTNF